MQEQIDDILTRLDENDSSLSDFSDSLDSNMSEMQSSIDDQSSSIDDLQQTAGQLTFPLSQDTIDLITEQSPAIMASYLQGNSGTFTMTAGSYTLTNPNITTNSIILFSMTSPANIPLVVVGAVYPIHYVTITTGQAVFHSTIATETSTFNYVIFN